MIETGLLYSLLRNDFKSFVIKTFNEISSNSVYKDNWHINLICWELAKVIRGEQNRLIINMPPRYLKSIICSVALPAFILGHNPKTNIVCASYSDDLANKMALDCRKIMESAWYRAAFPSVKLSKNKNAINDFETTAGGGRFSTSVGGTLTGRGGDYIIVDDPIKPSDAMSEVIRNKTNDWYSNTLYSRLNDKQKGKIIIIMQRTNQNDFTGFLMAQEIGFKLIKMPLLAEQDEIWEFCNYIGKKITVERKAGTPLHVGLNDERSIKEIIAVMSAYDFAGQYQQNPVSRGGNIIKRDWLKFFDAEKLKQDIKTGAVTVEYLGQSWDTAMKTGEYNDFSVCISFLKTTDRRYFVFDVYRGRLIYPQLERKLEELYNTFYVQWGWTCGRAPYIIVEEAGVGTALIQTFQDKLNIQGFKPKADKITRLSVESAKIEKGNCVFARGVWWDAFELELTAFPNGVHDDQCDALSQALACQIEVDIPQIFWI
jgi:predicted phage terminase large subunit-like protein